MLRSAGARFFIVAILALLMAIPVQMVSSIVDARRDYSRETLRDVGQEWGGEQVLAGPELVIPVRREVTETRTREVIDPVTGRVEVHPESGQPILESYETTRVEDRAPLVLLPGRFDARLTTATELRYRGIFEVPVYTAQVALGFDFPTEAAEAALEDGEEAVWDQARLEMFLSGNRALRGAAALTVDGAEVALEPLSGRSGIVASVGDIRTAETLALSLGLNGAERLMIAPVGRTSQVEIAGDWPDPAFTGAFLPDDRSVGPDGYEARWTIPHLARAVPQVARASVIGETGEAIAFGLRFYQPNDFYQKAWRAARYGLLTIALTFLTVLLIEGQRERPVHPVQYILIGLAQAIFVLLMVAYAEHIGFGPAYLLAAGATVALLVMFGWIGLKLGRRTLVLGVLLAVLYAVLWLILESTDYALLAGATLAFLALMATMIATRNEEWYAAPGTPGLLARRKAAPPPAAVPPDSAQP
ncbi:MAG: cell envelope integrity protein CreD [Maritimibacter sp.]|nr:cell envelope integrity protein CreD [Maritimibacter sp.]